MMLSTVKAVAGEERSRGRGKYESDDDVGAGPGYHRGGS
jgi:hypothetical protein